MTHDHQGSPSQVAHNGYDLATGTATQLSRVTTGPVVELLVPFVELLVLFVGRLVPFLELLVPFVELLVSFNHPG